MFPEDSEEGVLAYVYVRDSCGPIAIAVDGGDWVVADKVQLNGACTELAPRAARLLALDCARFFVQLLRLHCLNLKRMLSSCAALYRRRMVTYAWQSPSSSGALFDACSLPAPPALPSRPPLVCVRLCMFLRARAWLMRIQ